MAKKLLSSLVGVSSVFGVSLKNHVLSSNLSGKNKKFLPQSDFYFQTVSKELKRPELQLVNQKKSDRSLDRSHFGAWKYQSEGGNDSIYLVKKNHLITQVKASNHGQKRRFMRDGISIDKNNLWFGYRDVSKQFKKKLDKSHIEAIKEYKEMILKSFDKEELKLLGEWWKGRREDQQCEILEIIIECDTIRRSLGGPGITWIDQGLELNPVHLITLAGMSDRSFPKLSEIIGSKKLVHLPKKGQVGYLIGEVIDNWISDYIDKKYIEKEEKGEVNLVAFAEKLFSGEQAYKTCIKQEEDSLKIYEECYKEIQNFPEKASEREGEKNLLPSVSGIVKAAKIESNKVRVATGMNSSSSESERSWKDEKEIKEKNKEISSKLKSQGRNEGLIDINCDKESSWWILSWGKQTGCQMAWKMIFQGDIGDKRLCLFKIPDAKYYLREYQVSFLTLSNWHKNNQFWTKCSEYSI